MELIDKRGKINKVTFKQIVKEAVTAHLGIEFGSTSLDATPDMLLVTLFSQDIQDNKDIEVRIINQIDNKTYVFTGKDFNWFLKADRLKDLSTYVYGYDIFSLDDEGIEKAKKEIEQKKVTDLKQSKVTNLKQSKAFDATIYHIAVVSTKDPENPDVEDFKGLKHECIKWLNQQIVKNANLENEVSMLICLDFEAEDPDWKTLKELFDEGKIEI